MLTAAHKAKGLEWDNIYIMDDFLKIKSESKTRTKKNISLSYFLIIKEKWLDRAIKNINVADTETLKKIIKEKKSPRG